MLLFQDQSAKEKALQSMSSMSSAQIVSASTLHNKTSLSGLGLPAPVSYPPPVIIFIIIIIIIIITSLEHLFFHLSTTISAWKKQFSTFFCLKTETCWSEATFSPIFHLLKTNFRPCIQKFLKIWTF